MTTRSGVGDQHKNTKKEKKEVITRSILAYTTAALTLTVVICALALRGTNPLKMPFVKGTVIMYPIA